MTQTELAEIAGVVPNFISKLESGKGQASMATLNALAGALKVSVADLFEPSDHQERILAAVSQLPEEHRQIATDLVESYARTVLGQGSGSSGKGG